MIANRTIPPISVRVEPIDTEDVRVAKISVPRSVRPVSTANGVLQRRRIMADGKPQCVPFYPHEFMQREATLGVLDNTALSLMETTPDDFDPFERGRLRQMITRYGGDGTLSGLDDRELEGALGFVEGVTIQNLLVVEPKPRNPLRADAVKRIGLAERTGRGVDLIYQGILR